MDRFGFERPTLTLWSREGAGGKRIELPRSGGPHDLGDVVLEPRRVLRGTIVHGRTRAPAAGALIEPLRDEASLDDRSLDRPGTDFYAYGEDVPGSVRSDDRGRFSIATCQSIPVRISSAGLVARDLPGSSSGGKIFLEPTPMVEVTVPRARAPTCVEAAGRASIRRVYSPEIVTDDGGHARIWDLQPGPLQLRRGCWGESAPWLTIEVVAGETLRVELP